MGKRVIIIESRELKKDVRLIRWLRRKHPRAWIRVVKFERVAKN